LSFASGRAIPAAFSLAVAACACVLAPPAAPATTIRFNTGGPGLPAIMVTDNRRSTNGYLELVRGREVVARSPARHGIAASSGHLTVPNLLADDVARAFGNGAVIASATYDGGPRIGADACAGSRAFTVTRPVGSEAGFAAAFRRSGAPVPGQRLRWTDTAVAADRPLAAGQMVRVLTRRDDGGIEVVSRGSGVVAACAAPSDAQVLSATRRALARTGAKLRPGARTLPFAFPEPGSVWLEVRERAGALIGVGRKRNRRAGTAGVRIRWTGRRLPARVTLSAYFAPERAGASAQLGLRAATLRR
jgi:hypothetical protein